MKLWHLALVGVSGATLLAFVASVLGFGTGACHYRVIDSAISPSGEFTAVAYHRECGGALSSGGSVEFALTPAGDPPPEARGNLGAIYTKRWCPGTRQTAIVSWTNRQEVKFTYHESASVSGLRHQLRGVAVSYAVCTDAI